MFGCDTFGTGSSSRVIGNPNPGFGKINSGPKQKVEDTVIQRGGAEELVRVIYFSGYRAQVNVLLYSTVYHILRLDRIHAQTPGQKCLLKLSWPLLIIIIPWPKPELILGGTVYHLNNLFDSYS